MAAIYVKCLICGQRFDRTTVPCVQVGRRYQHASCSAGINLTEEQKEITLQNTQIVEDEIDDFFVHYVKVLRGSSEYDYMYIRSLGETYVRKYQFKWKSMGLVLRYLSEKGIVDMKNDNRCGMGLVPYYYTIARDYYKEIFDTNNHNREFGKWSPPQEEERNEKHQRRHLKLIQI